MPQRNELHRSSGHCGIGRRPRAGHHRAVLDREDPHDGCRRNHLFADVAHAAGLAYAGSTIATTFGWGYFTSGIAFLVAIVAIGAAYYAVNAMISPGHRHRSTAEVLTFWLAYVLTRPLGASFADWMSMPRERGGLAWGDGLVSIVLFVIIAGFVAYLAATRRDVQRSPDLAAAPAT